MNRNRLTRAIATAFLGGSLLAASVPALSHGPGHGGPGGPGYGRFAEQMTDADRARMQERRQAGMKQRLDRMAERLDIKSSQQDAWAEYRKVRESLMGTPPQFPAKDADAATITRFRAEMAQRRAAHMAVMANATARLQEALDADQRRILAEMSRGGGRGGHRGPQGFGPHRGQADAEHPHGQQHRHHAHMGQV